MKIIVRIENIEEFEKTKRISEILRKNFPHSTIRIEGYFEIPGLPTREEFDLTKEMEEVLKKNRNRWLTARDIIREIATKYGVTPQQLEQVLGYKSGGLGKGIAASGMKLENEGKIEVDKSKGPGNYMYKWK